MKNVVFIHGGDVFKKKYPVKERTIPDYERLIMMARDYDLHIVWSNIKYFNSDKKCFTGYSMFNGEKWELQHKDIVPHYIFDKSTFKYERILIKEEMMEVAPFLNPSAIDLISSNKLLSYLTFPGEVYKSFLVRDQRDLLTAIKKITTRKVVLKPLKGSAGKGILFLTKQEAQEFIPERRYIIQEFIDSSNGIPGIYNDIHDLRLLFLDNEFAQSFYRTQAPGSLMCNVSQGASQILVPYEKLPQAVLQKAQVVQERFKQYNNTFYSVDLMYDSDGTVKIIEINSMPGLANAPGYENGQQELFEKILTHIQKYAV